MGLTECLAEYITNFIGHAGYLSVFALMVGESMVLPIPSEAVMPFAGFLIAAGRFSYWGVILMSTLGSIAGSLISYAIGKYAGKPFLEKYGKFLLLRPEELVKTEKFFNKRGSIAIFIGRFIPIVRHLISLPAGFASMNIWRFSLYTIIGAGVWNAFLAFVGVALRQRWEEVLKYSRILDIVIIVFLMVIVLMFFYKKFKKTNPK